MKVFVAGATGVIGRRIVRLLVEEGHEVTGVCRSDSKAVDMVAAGATPASVDLFDSDGVLGAVLGQDAIINVATAIPVGNDAAKKSAWEMNHRIRRQVSANLTKAGLAAGVTRFVQESITFLYADGGDRFLDETDEVAPTWVTASALDAEANTLAAAEAAKGDTNAVVLRFGSFYAPDAAHTLDILASARTGKAASVGPGDRYWSSIHADDAAAAAVAALRAPSGIYNVVDDQPMTRRETFDALGSALGKRGLAYPSPLADRVIRLIMGKKLEMVSRSFRVSNAAFKRATGWKPAYPSVREGWREVVGSAAS